MIEKVNSQEKRLGENDRMIREIDGKISEMSSQKVNVNQLAELVKQLREKMSAIKWPAEKINELSLRLEINNNLLSNPVKTKQTVVHTAGKLIWVIALLSITVISLIIGIVETAGKLERYKTNDMLWRYLKVSSNSNDLKYLQTIERLYPIRHENMKVQVEEAELKEKQIAESVAVNRDQRSDSSISQSKKAKSRTKRSK